MKTIIAATLALMAAVGWKQASAQLTVLSGLEYLSGDYGKSTSSDEWKIPLVAIYRQGPWSFRASLPFRRAEGVANLLEQEARDESDDRFVGDDDDDDEGGGGGGGAGGFSSTQVKRSQTGFGDLTLGANYLILEPLKHQLGMELGARMKLPVANEDRCYLTNGAVDFSVQADLFQSYGQFDPYLSLGWTLKGDPNRRDSSCALVSGKKVNLRNPLYIGFGVGLRMDDDLSLRVEYEFREKLRSSSDPRSEAKLSLTKRLDQHMRLGIYGLLGFSDNSPEWGIGTAVSYRF